MSATNQKPNPTGKRLIMCCDGTWNTPDEKTDGKTTPTNVTKVCLAIAPTDADGREQRAFYHRGVGTTRRQRVVGGAFGFGLSRDVLDTYRFIVANYAPGDELFFFGFSRGAFTARSTAGLVRNAGILRAGEEGRIGEAYALYRSRASGPRDIEARLFRKSLSHEARVRFIGVWETVGALGIPAVGGRFGARLNRRWQFHDTDLSTSVDAAFQALSIDERRGAFVPAIWRQQAEAVDQQLEQVWFAGVHGDVGGGYPNSDLSEITLSWMSRRAAACGLAFSEPPAELDKGWATGPLHDSFKGIYRLQKAHARAIGDIDPDHEFLSSTAAERTRGGGYEPHGILDYLKREGQTLQI